MEHRPLPQFRFAFSSLLLGLALAAPVAGQTLLYREGFNDDGEAGTPRRYTLTGRDVYEVARIRSELNEPDQKGPVFWAHNFEVSAVGIPTIPARRMMMTWRGVDAAAATEEFWSLWNSTVDWLLDGRPNAVVVIHPNAAACQALAARLAAAGHTVLDDDPVANPDELAIEADLFIHGPGAGQPSRFVLVPKPVIVISAPDYDDLLVGSVGEARIFEPGPVSIATPGHPAAGGRTGRFTGLTGDQPFELTGPFLPEGAIPLATVSRTVPATVASLADVDAMIEGTRPHEISEGLVTALDFWDGSDGQWSVDEDIPGGYLGVWGLRAIGRLAVSAPGTYRFALGSEKGARLQVDLNRDGLTLADTVLENPGPHGHQVAYADVTFPEAGLYGFEVRSFNSGGPGSLELSVARRAGPVPDNALSSGFWELLGAPGAVSPVRLDGPVAATGYLPIGGSVDLEVPLIVLLNGPADNPPGRLLDGGPFTGFEGAGFLAGAGLDRWPYAEGQNHRSVRLGPIPVAGQPNLRLTVALAATGVDFEDSDFLEIVAYPQGESGRAITLARFQGVENALQPWLADALDGFSRRLTRQFSDFTYPLPADSTDMIVEVRAGTTWWTEIVALDDVRITTAPNNPPLGALLATVSGDTINLSWSGGTPPFVVEGKVSLSEGAWNDLATVSAGAASLPATADGGVFRVRDSSAP